MVTPSPHDRAAIPSSLLQPFWCCQGLSVADLARVAQAASFRSIDRGEVVIDYGDRVCDLYCVLGGLVKLLVKTAGRKERIIELVGAGQTFGEGLIFLGRPSPGRAVAIDDGRLLLVPADVLTDLLECSAGLAVRWLRRVGWRVGQLLAELEADTGQSAAQRIIRWLVAKAGTGSGETRIRLDISKATLAASLNATPETFSRVLRHLREQGVVRVDGPEIVVVSPARLRYLQPCVFCGKPHSDQGAATALNSPVSDPLVAVPADCDVPHWFGTCDCDVPHWCAGNPVPSNDMEPPTTPTAP